MSESIAIHDQYMNITYRVVFNTYFSCECGWHGMANQLIELDGFSACPACGDYDVRIIN